MRTNLIFDFTVDKNTNTVYVNREFAAERTLVWDAFTKQELLDQWWAPKPWISKTKYMNFEIGGRRFYAMVSPEGQEFWSIQDYTSITPTTSFEFFDAFTDKNETINAELPSSEWHLDFKETNGVTKVEIMVKHKTLAHLEQIIEMGFQEGFTMTLNDLELLLNSLSNKAS